MNKVVIILVNPNDEVLKTGVLYGANAVKYKWFEDVKFFVFGASQEIILKNDELLNTLKKLQAVACKFVAKEKGIDKLYKEKGFNLEYIGEPLSNLINEGYVPMVF
ncbi:hypothetical protein SAMN05660835_01123 [Desulfurella multipotens]|uniref:DsrE/DsrF-like family protein n=1 Tax=Desulfurella multipotens TaxID=79269 RepID=A0A1G6N5J7_9BACT|nr:hypothetical protein [Desulfurella multipotens]SDC63100.1 hypothetical protein SAMN05660835_01123 [Desulfurella multipotens]